MVKRFLRNAGKRLKCCRIFLLSTSPCG